MHDQFSLVGTSRLPIMRQATAAECGLACLAMIAWYHGSRSDLGELRRKHAISLRGADLTTLLDVAKQLDLGGRAVRCELDELKQLRLPAMLHANFNHFVVLRTIKGRRFVVHDPAVGERDLDRDEMGRLFTGVAVEFTPTEKFKPKTAPRKLSLFSLIRLNASFFSPFSLGLTLAVFAELALLASPFFLQLLVDEVLVKGDTPLLWALGLGFGGLLIFQMLSTLLRGLTLQYLGQSISFDINSRLVSRMLNLTSDFFANRQLGDIQHRVQSLRAIQQFLTTGGVSIFTDTVFILLIILIMALYSGVLLATAAGMIALYGLWRWALFGSMKKAAGDLLVAEAGEQTHLLETLRSIPTIKTSNLESTRETQWRNRMVRKLNAYIRQGNIGLTEQSGSALILEGGRLIILLFAASQVMAGNLTIGMLTAFASYFGMLSGRIQTLISSLIQFRLLDVPLMRVADIAFAREEAPGEPGGRDQSITGAVQLQNVTFAYSRHDKAVLANANLEAPAGSFVALVGPSGAGKSTLIKLIAGLLQPTAGQILFDGKPYRTFDRHALRAQIGVVLQDDALLQGSLAENIAAFADRIDMDRVREAAKASCIDQEIEAFPMGYETLVGDMGSTLSGGQKQRVILARALYHRPKLLLLDEATSHLDPRNEVLISVALRDLSITRIVSTHQPQTIQSADMRFRVKGGNIIPFKEAP